MAYTIAIVVSLNGPSHREVIDGFLHSLHTRFSPELFTVTVHSAGTYDKARVKSLLFKVYNDPSYDLVFLIGSTPFTAALTFIPWLPKHTIRPTLFCATAEGHTTLTYDELTAEELPFFTGVELYKTPTFFPLEMLPRINKSMKKVLAPHTNDPLIKKGAEKVERALQKAGITVQRLEVKKIEHYSEEIKAALSDHDTLIFSFNSWEAYTTEYEKIKTYCGEKKITFFSTSGEQNQGVMFGITHTFTKLGQAAAQVVSRILIDKEDITTIPVHYIYETHRSFTIKKEALEKLGVVIAPDLITHIQNDQLPLSYFMRTIGTLIMHDSALYRHLVTTFTDYLKRYTHIWYNPHSASLPVITDTVQHHLKTLLEKQDCIIIAGSFCINQMHTLLQKQQGHIPRIIGIVHQADDPLLFFKLYEDKWPYHPIMPLGIASVEHDDASLIASAPPHSLHYDADLPELAVVTDPSQLPPAFGKPKQVITTEFLFDLTVRGRFAGTHTYLYTDPASPFPLPEVVYQPLRYPLPIDFISPVLQGYLETVLYNDEVLSYTKPLIIKPNKQSNAYILERAIKA